MYKAVSYTLHICHITYICHQCRQIITVDMQSEQTVVLRSSLPLPVCFINKVLLTHSPAHLGCISCLSPCCDKMSGRKQLKEARKLYCGSQTEDAVYYGKEVLLPSHSMALLTSHKNANLFCVSEGSRVHQAPLTMLWKVTLTMRMPVSFRAACPVSSVLSLGHSTEDPSLRCVRALISGTGLYGGLISRLIFPSLIWWEFISQVSTLKRLVWKTTFF